MANVASFEFVDIDHFREQLRGWDTPAIQVERGQISIRLHSIDLGGLVFSDIQLNRKVIDHSRPHGDWLKCVINLSPAIFCGFEVAAGHLVILAPGREYRSILANSWHSIEIVASLSLLADEGLTPAPYLLSGPENAIVLLRPELVGIFRNLAEATFGRSANGRIDDLRLRSALLRALDKAFAMGARQVSDHRRRAEGHELTHRVLRFVESRFGRRITVEEVACELDVTTRALHYAVRSTLGISPLELILALRLNHVRNHLWETRSFEPNITTAALAQDFGHLGRFSQQYCALFGELPSRTVRRIRSLTS